MMMDLVVLAADKNIDQGLQGLLTRPASLGIRPIQIETLVHPRRDPGCFLGAQDVLRSYLRGYAHALVVFDRAGCGQEKLACEELAEVVRKRLAANGWDDRAEAIVIDPEIEVWVFANSNAVEECLGWPASRAALRKWLESRGLWGAGQLKPQDPRIALDEALYEIKRPRSAAVYRRLGEKVDFRTCADPSFVKLRQTLLNWFSNERAK